VLTTALQWVLNKLRYYTTLKNENFNKCVKEIQIPAATTRGLPVSWDRKTLCWAQQCKTLTSCNLETPNIIHGWKFWYGTAYWFYKIKVMPNQNITLSHLKAGAGNPWAGHSNVKL
jgi:hypothetical protein